MKEYLDNKYSDEKLQQMVDKVLSTGIFEGVNGELMSIQDAMLQYIDKYEDGMSVIGGIIKDEWITNLEIAKETMKDIEDIYSKLNFKTLSSSLAYSEVPNTRSVMPTSTVSNSITISSPLIVVEGNVDENVIPDLERIVEEVTDRIISEYR